MILEEETFRKFGYHSKDLKPKSGKAIRSNLNDLMQITGEAD